MANLERIVWQRQKPIKETNNKTIKLKWKMY